MLQQAAQERTYVSPAAVFLEQPGACELLGVDEDAVEKHYMDMAIDKKLVLKQTMDQVQIYASAYYYMETNVAVMLRELNVKYDVSDAEIDRRISQIEKNLDMELDEMQKVAVRESVHSGCW